MKIITALFAVLPAVLMAQDWNPLDGAAIKMTLTDQSVIYDGATQHFYASGRTLYDAGQESWGYWAVRGHQYCSQWPPGDQWDCYNVARAPGLVRFFAGDGSATDGAIAE